MSDETVEGLAQEMGWVPKEDFKGREDDWRPASDFIKATNDIARKSSDKNTDLRRQIADVQGKLDNMVSNQAGNFRRAMDAANERLQAQMRQAVEEGDTAKYDTAQAEMQNMHKHQAQQARQQPDPARVTEFQSGFEKFKQANDWYERDPHMTREAEQAGQWFIQRNQNATPEDYFNYVEESVKKAFPQQFSNPARNRPSDVAGDRPPQTAAGDSWKQVKAEYPEVEMVFGDLVSSGVYKDTKEDRETYAKQVLAT